MCLVMKKKKRSKQIKCNEKKNNTHTENQEKDRERGK